ncbi:MAG TPA: DUF1800 domain-containing protein [Phycisphaerae bacterium]|nr:DUF1800 domain-containing protein [Phycisphaerae bacterium]
MTSVTCISFFLLGSLLAIEPRHGEAADLLASSSQWTPKHAGHLLRRAGFGGTPEQIQYLKKLGREKAVEYLVHYESIEGGIEPLELDPYEPRRPFGARGKNKADRQKQVAQNRREDRLLLEDVLGWWLEAMVMSPRPLEEKLTLFWHGHFTSGYREVKSSHAMLKQNRTLRRHASGNFRQMLLDVTHDPAMILYLNMQQNRKDKPNENYARELLELFTLGPGHYTEKDIKEAARAFTGIAVDQQTGEHVFRWRQHDDGEKSFLGRTGDLEAADIIDAILEQPAASRFIARKAWCYFAYPDPEEDVVEALARVLRENNHEFKPMLTAMFMSDAFYSPRAMFTQIKSPTQLMVGTMRALEIAPHDAAALNIGLRMMGQSLMQPPNVKGWDGGAAWITASTLYNRYNVMGALIAGNDNVQSRRRRQRVIAAMRQSLGQEAPVDEAALSRLQPPFDPLPAVEKRRLTTAEKLVDHYAEVLLQRPLKPEKRKLLIETMKPHYDRTNPKSGHNMDVIRGLIHLIVSMPEYQLS